jgi:uncharacterized protein YqhQ
MGRIEVGGQAVIEGVMMRSPRSFAVVCRRPNGTLVVKEDAWQPLWARLRFLRWPVLRGAIVLLESLWNGMTALSFAAEQQEIPLEPRAQSLGAAAAPQTQSALAKAGLVAVSLAFGLALFVGAPHLLAWALGHLVGYDATSFWFHAADGAIKVTILVGYLWAISFLPDIRRVFQYHGAEHKAIYTYEKGLDLTVENARAQTRFHPRCGTSFLLLVVLVSVALFAAVLRGRVADSVVVDHLVKILVKIPLMFPIAGLAYELIKLSGRFADKSVIARIFVAPGLWLQKITTREPDDSQLEVALVSIRKTLWRERSGEAAEGGVEVFASAAEVDLPLA